MSVTTHTIDSTRFTLPAPPVRTGGISRILRSEWTKLRTLSSTWRTVVAATALSIALGIVFCASQANAWTTMTAAQRHTFDPTACSLAGFFIGAVVLGALAARSVTSEYSSGMIRSTFTATPNRRMVLAAKAVVTAVFVFPVALVADVVSFEVGQRIFASKHIGVTLGDPGVLRAVIFGALATSLIALIGVGLGGLIRHTAAATTALVLVIVGGAVFGQLLPAGLRPYLPGTALQAAITVNNWEGLLKPGAAMVALCTYAAIALTAASIRVGHRNA